MKMKFSCKMQLYCFFFDVVVGIGFIWMLLEYLIYGEVQPRIVDDIVNILYIAAIFYAYKLGRSHEREFHKNYRFIENWYTNSPTYLNSFDGASYNNKNDNHQTGGDSH